MNVNAPVLGPLELTTQKEKKDRDLRQMVGSVAGNGRGVMIDDF